jgi:hypothetical protein
MYSLKSRPDVHATRTSAPPSAVPLISLSVRHCRLCLQLQAASAVTSEKHGAGNYAVLHLKHWGSINYGRFRGYVSLLAV